MADAGGGSRTGNFFIGARNRLIIQSETPTTYLPDSVYLDIFAKSDGLYFLNSEGTAVKILDSTNASAGIFTTLAASGNFAINTNKFNVTATNGNTAIAGTLNVTGLSTFGSFKGTVALGGAVVALTSSTTIALNSTLGNVFTLVPAHTATINCATVAATGQEITLRILTSGGSSFTLTFGTNFKSTGTLATGTADAKVFVIKFVSDGTTMNEVCRTTAM